MRLLGIPDSADFFEIFNPSFAIKAWEYSKFNYCYSYESLVKDTANKDFENIKLINSEVDSYFARNRYSNLFVKLDSAEYFLKNPDIPIYDIKRGKTHIDYYAMEWVYINNKWVCFYDLWDTFRVLDEPRITEFQNFVCPKKK